MVQVERKFPRNNTQKVKELGRFNKQAEMVKCVPRKQGRVGDLWLSMFVIDLILFMGGISAILYYKYVEGVEGKYEFMYYVIGGASFVSIILSSFKCLLAKFVPALMSILMVICSIIAFVADNKQFESAYLVFDIVVLALIVLRSVLAGFFFVKFNKKDDEQPLL